MARFGRLFLITILLLGLMFSTTAVITGCGSDTTTTGAATTTAAKDTSTVIGDRALKTLASMPVSGDYNNDVINGKALATKLADPAEKAKLFLLDIRAKADYDKAHIEGTTQLEFKQWATPENLAKLPKDKKIVVICYTGNTAAQAASGMRMLGYDAVILKAGMMGWAQNSETAVVIGDLGKANYPVTTTPAVAAQAAPPAETFAKPSDADYTVLAEQAAKVMSAMPADGDFAKNTIMPAKLSEKLAGADKSKLFVLDIRAKADFEKGQIEGATNIPFLSVAVPDNLKVLPKDKTVIVVCYTGNTAAQTTMILRMLGYDAVTLKYGMMGWDGSGKDAYIQGIQDAANPTVAS